MPAPRKPTVILDLEGAFRRNPSRALQRQHEPIPERGGPGEPPSRMRPDEVAIWYELIETAHAGTFSKADRVALEIAVDLLSEYRAGPRAFPNSRLLRLQMALQAFGMTPADRSRISVLSARTVNKFASIGL